MPSMFQDDRRSRVRGPSYPPRPIKGFMIALNSETGQILLNPPIMFQFMYNPNEFSDRKEVAYVATTIPGLDRPLYSYSNGGERILEFSLMLNSYEYGTEKSTVMTDVPGMGGISSELAKLQSFLYPQPTKLSGVGDVAKFAVAGLGGTSALSFINLFRTGKASYAQQFTPPPKCLFGFGVDIYETIVKGIDIRETMWNSTLDPLRAEVRITLGVDENAKRVEMNHARRKMLAALGSITNTNPLSSIPVMPSIGRIG